MATGPLSGVRVVELCGWFTGPMSATILGDQGADVIKVEPLGGDEYRNGSTRRAGYSAAFMLANRNKRSIALDLKKPSNAAALHKILATADVFIQNQRPGAVERLGLGAEQLRAAFPRLIHVSISAFGPTGPKCRERGFDTMIQAMTGMAAVQGGADKPQMIRTLVPDKTTSPIVAQAICAALFDRERTGKGCTIQYAMLDAMVWWMWPDVMINDTFIGEGVTPGSGASDADFMCRTADGYIVVAPHQDAPFRSFAEAVGRMDLLEHPVFSTANGRMSNIGTFSAVVRECLGGKTTDEWCAVFAEGGVPYAAVRRVNEVADDPQVRWNEILEEVEHPEAGRYRAPKAPVFFDGERLGVWRHVPAIGGDTEEILAEFGIALDAAEARAS